MHSLNSSQTLFYSYYQHILSVQTRCKSTMTSPIGLWTTFWNLEFGIMDIAILFFLEPEPRAGGWRTVSLGGEGKNDVFPGHKCFQTNLFVKWSMQKQSMDSDLISTT